MAIIRVLLHNRAGVARAELRYVQSATIAEVLNAAGSATLSLSGGDPGAISGLLTGAPLLTIESEMGEWGGVIKKPLRQVGHALAIAAYGNERLLERRETAQSLTLSGDSGTIARNLLEAVNAISNTGVTVGIISTGGDLDTREYHKEDLYAALRDLAAAWGRDWDVDAQRRLNWYTQKGIVRNNIVFSEGHNVVAWPTYTYDEDAIVNSQTVIGGGETWSTRPIHTETHGNSIASYGLSESTELYANLTESAAVNAAAATLLAQHCAPSEMLDIVCVNRPAGIWQQFGVGDRVRVRLPSYKFGEGFDGLVRVLARELSIPAGVMRLVVEVQ